MPYVAHFGFCSVTKFLSLFFGLVLLLASGVASANYPATAIGTWNGLSASGANAGEVTGKLCVLAEPYMNNPVRNPHRNVYSCAGSRTGYWSFYMKSCSPDGSYCTSPPHIEQTGVSGNYVCAGGETPNTSLPLATMCPGTAPPVGPPPVDCSDKNPMIRKYNYGANGPFSSPTNFAGCVVTPVEMLACHKGTTGTYCYWKIVRTGEKYTGPEDTTTGAGSTDTSTPPTSPPPLVPSPPIKPPPPATPDICKTCVPCPKGTVQAGIGSDGVPMCVGTGTNPPPPPVPPPSMTKPPTTTTGSDGSTVTKQETVQQNKDGSTTTTTTTTTTAPDGSKSVTVSANTTNAATGSPGSMDGNPQDDKYNLCKQNPTLSICRESSVSGACGEITCTGDAIQCSTLRAAAAMQCKQQADEDALKASPQTSLGNSILSGSDPMKADIESTLKGTEVDLSKPVLDSSGFLGGGTCLPNRSFAVMGRSVTVDFTSLCNSIQPLRAVIMACAFIAAYMLVSRSVVQS